MDHAFCQILIVTGKLIKLTMTIWSVSHAVTGSCVWMCVWVTHWCRGPRASGFAGTLWRSGCRWCPWHRPCRGTGLSSGCMSCLLRPQGGSHKLAWGGGGVLGEDVVGQIKEIRDTSSSNLLQNAKWQDKTPLKFSKYYWLMIDCINTECLGAHMSLAFIPRILKLLHCEKLHAYPENWWEIRYLCGGHYRTTKSTESY